MIEVPLLSIIVPVYNASHCLDHLINTICNQSFTNWELLLINDGSTDNSGEICDRWSQKDDRIHSYHKSNGGQSSARNFGIGKSVGEYIYFVDNDDELLDGCLQTLIDGMQLNQSIDLCVGKPLFSRNGIIVNHLANETEITNIFSVDQVLCEFFSPKYYHFGGPWSTLFKSSIIKKYNLRYNESFKGSEDRVFLVSYLCHITGQVYHTTTPIYVWNIGVGTLKDISSSYNLWFLTIFLGQAEIYEMLKKKGVNIKILWWARHTMINSYYDKRKFYERFDDKTSIKRIDDRLFSLISHEDLYLFRLREFMKKSLKPLLPFLRRIRTFFNKSSR